MKVRIRRIGAIAIAGAATLVLVAGSARASALSDDLTAQRYSLDIDDAYRQDSNLSYLTGLTQDEMILVLMPGNASRREILFVNEKNPAQEHWRARTLSAQEGARFFDALTAGRARGAVSWSDPSIVGSGPNATILHYPDSDQYRIWYTHGASHYIGIDVHDVGDTKRPREGGMAFTIEPGLYIRQSALGALPRTPENDAFIAKVQPSVRKYADLGVRVEDSFLLEESGLRRLSAAVPRTIDEIEAFMRTRPAASAAVR